MHPGVGSHPPAVGNLMSQVHSNLATVFGGPRGMFPLLMRGCGSVISLVPGTLYLILTREWWVGSG